MIRKISALKKARKLSNKSYSNLETSCVSLDTIIQFITSTYRGVTENNTASFLTMLKIKFVDTTTQMSKVIPNDLPDYVSSHHVLLKTPEGKVAVEFNFIEGCLANCRINVFCDNPSSLQKSLFKKMRSLGEDIDDERLNHYQYKLFIKNSQLLYGTYTSTDFADALYIHLTAMEYSGL